MQIYGGSSICGVGPKIVPDLNRYIQTKMCIHTLDEHSGSIRKCSIMSLLIRPQLESHEMLDFWSR